VPASTAPPVSLADAVSAAVVVSAGVPLSAVPSVVEPLSPAGVPPPLPEVLPQARQRDKEATSAVAK